MISIDNREKSRKGNHLYLEFYLNTEDYYVTDKLIPGSLLKDHP